jgi:hypothetical protein
VADDRHKETPSIGGGTAHPFSIFYDMTHDIVKRSPPSYCSASPGPL